MCEVGCARVRFLTLYALKLAYESLNRRWAGKLEMINKTFAPDSQGLHVRSDSHTFHALRSWIAHSGQYYNTRQDLHG